MSADIEDMDHINALVNLAIFGPKGRHHWSRLTWYAAPATFWQTDTPNQQEMATDSTARRVGQMLHNVNVESVNYRYNDTTAPEHFVWHPTYDVPTALEGLKVISCYEYQSCEHPGWKTSEAYAFCDSLRHSLISNLPGYDDANGWPWHSTQPATGGRITAMVTAKTSQEARNLRGIQANAATAAMREEVPYLSCAQVAVHVRTALAKAFPTVKFSVRSKTYSGGASIGIHWTDGPTTKMVDAITDGMRGASFDSMTDLKSHRGALTFPDGSRGHSGAHYISSHRNFSPEMLARIAADVTRKYGIHPGDALGSLSDRLPYPLCRCYNFNEAVHQVAHETAC